MSAIHEASELHVGPVRHSSLDPTETKCPPRLSQPDSATMEANHSLDTDYTPALNPSQVFRHSGWRPLRTRIIAALKRTKQTAARYESYVSCGEQAYILKSGDEPPQYRVAGSNCHDRFCVPCAQERSSTIAHNVMDHLAGRKTRFVTLTLQHRQCTLADALDHLYASWKRLRKQRGWKWCVTGGIAFVEVKHSPATGCWHPHIHALIEGRYYPQDELSRAWHTATGDSKIVDIRLVHGTAHVARYVTKYASKPLNHTFQFENYLLDEAIVGLKGRRLAMTFGTWRGIKLADSPAEDGWENVGTLAAFLESAARGDAEALAILNRIAPERAAAAISEATVRGPPEKNRPNFGREQGVLFVSCDSRF